MAFGKLFWVAIYLAFGGYLINYSFQFYPIKEIFSGMNNYIIFIGGALIVFSGINLLLTRKTG